MTKVITIGNLKGGVGKTTSAVLIANRLSKREKKTLLIDLDTSADATTLVFTTMVKVLNKEPEYNITLYNAIEKEIPAEEVVINVQPYLDLIPSDEDFEDYGDLLNSKFDKQRDKDFYLSEYLKDVIEQYEYVIIDVPPSVNIYTDSALTMSDYILIALQTQKKSLRRAKRFASYMSSLRNAYGLKFQALGVLPVLFENGSDYDLETMGAAADYFGDENIFTTTIKQMKRIKRFDWSGITNDKSDPHDNSVHRLYDSLVDEMLERIGNIEEDENNGNV